MRTLLIALYLTVAQVATAEVPPDIAAYAKVSNTARADAIKQAKADLVKAKKGRVSKSDLAHLQTRVSNLQNRKEPFFAELNVLGQDGQMGYMEKQGKVWIVLSPTESIVELSLFRTVSANGGNSNKGTVHYNPSLAGVTQQVYTPRKFYIKGYSTNGWADGGAVTIKGIFKTGTEHYGESTFPSLVLTDLTPYLDEFKTVSKPRTWHLKQGSELQGEFIKYERGKVNIAEKAGTIDVPLIELSKEDAAYVREQIRPPK
jgi:hypothetical protein